MFHLIPGAPAGNVKRLNCTGESEFMLWTCIEVKDVCNGNNRDKNTWSQCRKKPEPVSNIVLLSPVPIQGSPPHITRWKFVLTYVVNCLSLKFKRFRFIKLFSQASLIVRGDLIKEGKPLAFDVEKLVYHPIKEDKTKHVAGDFCGHYLCGYEGVSSQVVLHVPRKRLCIQHTGNWPNWKEDHVWN